ncbi:MAG: hypothetical protein QOE20_64, partial [Mycobacterium sp.]|nr:hypothetical protein [Mycobacterium sp.]
MDSRGVGDEGLREGQMTLRGVETMTPDVRPSGTFIDTDLSADLAAAALSVARRFHDGATLWVISPQWEPHAHHVAVE